MQNFKRETYADALRIIAAFIVVFQHTVTSAWYTVPVDSSEFAALNFLNSLSRFGVGIFIMISGAFMLSPKYPHPPKKILTHNIPRTLIPLIFWVLVYGIVEQIASGNDVVELLKTPLLLFTDPASHLWFLYTIIGLYILTPPLRVFTEHASQKMMLYVIAVFFAFGLLQPTADYVLKKFADFSMYRNLGIRGATSFVGFYLTGFYLSHYELSAKSRKILYGAALASWIVAFAAASYISELGGKPNEYFFGNFRPTTFLMAAGIFCLFKNRFKNDLGGSRLYTFSNCMMGVYLIHPLFIKSFYGLHLTLLKPSPIITAPLLAIVFFGLSFATVYAFKKVPWLKKLF